MKNVKRAKKKKIVFRVYLYIYRRNDLIYFDIVALKLRIDREISSQKKKNS